MRWLVTTMPCSCLLSTLLLVSQKEANENCFEGQLSRRDYFNCFDRAIATLVAFARNRKRASHYRDRYIAKVGNPERFLRHSVIGSILKPAPGLKNSSVFRNSTGVPGTHRFLPFLVFCIAITAAGGPVVAIWNRPRYKIWLGRCCSASRNISDGRDAARERRRPIASYLNRLHRGYGTLTAKAAV
jgi:hypothetical protein